MGVRKYIAEGKITSDRFTDVHCGKNLEYSTASRCSSDSDDEEPVSKQPRLSRRQSSNLCSSQDEIRSVGSAGNKSGGATRRRHSLRSRRQLKAKTRQRRSSSEALVAGAKARKLEGSSSCSDSDVSSENRSVDDGSYFEDDLDELCATSLKSEEAKQSGRAYAGSSAFGGDQGAEADIEEAGLSEEEPENAETLTNMTPNPEPVSAATPASKPIDGSPDEIDAGCAPNPAKANDTPKRRRTEIDEAALRFNTSNRKSKNCATFYFKHMDTDSEADNNNNGEPQPTDNLQNRTADESTEEEWTYVAGKMRQRVDSKVKKQLDFIVQSSEPLEESDLLNGNVIATKEEEGEEAGRSLNSSNSEEGVLRRERINKLVKEVEQLVQQGAQGKHRVPQLAFDEDTKDLLSPQNHRAKYARIKQWLELNTGSKSQAKSASQYCRLTAAEPLDSGDASNEYTTDDSEVERQYRTFEEDLRDSIASYYCRPDNPLRLNSNEELLVEEMEEAPGPNKSSDSSSPKVVLRGKHHRRGGARPWSVSCISQIKKRGSTDSNAPLPQHSISETALNKLVDDPAANSSSVDSSESRVPFNNSTSTLLGEQINGHDAARVARNSSLRRKKNRLRKKNTGRKSESGSDNVTTSGGQQRTGGSEESIASRMKLRRARGSRAGSVLSKSGSFSGCANHGQERMSSSWSDSQSKPPQKTSSESEEEVDEAAAALAVTAAAATVALAVNRCRAVRYRGRLDSQPLHGGSIASCRPSPIAGASDNENNSFGAVSLEAWDNYQDKYSSEPYSEVVDTEAANRILEFGDDYRNYFDSQSDVSAYSIDAAYHRGDTYTSEESDSDSEVRHLTEVSHRQLLLTESSCSYGSANNLNELARVCRENIRCLRAISETRCGSRHGDRHAKQIRGLMERWESLSLRAEEAQKINAIHREMAAMKLEFCAAHERLMSYRVVLEEPNVIEDRINRITNELANLRDRKPAMLALNVSTHRLITDLGQKTSPTFAALKEGVADLYRLWDEAFQKGNQQLCALQAIQQFGARLTELQSALRRDKDTLAVLDAALQAGATMEVASSVKDVARLLSEKHEGNSQDSLLSESSLSKSNASEDSGNGTQSSFADSTTLVGHEGGSLSDSGISDSGSEQELSERERRLAALRRLTRTLESQLMPETSGDGLLVELWRRVEEAEAELRALQSQCRELIVRTAASVEARSASRPQPPAATTLLSYPVPSKRKKLPAFDVPTAKSASGEKPSVGGCTAADDPESEPSVPRSWVWRILRAALPFQLALVVLFCAACLLEPHCCEASNSLNLSLTPQLRYVRGPPPV